MYPSQTTQRNYKGMDTSELILQGQGHPDNKTKDTTKIEKYKKVWLMNVDVKILNKISANWNQQYIEKIICYEQAGLILGMQA